MVTDADRFEQVIVTHAIDMGARDGAPVGAVGVLMDIFDEFVVIEVPPADECSYPDVWMVARDAVARYRGTQAA